MNERGVCPFDERASAETPLSGPRGIVLRWFWKSRRGTAALEFALVAPFLITLLLGGFEITRYIKTARHLTVLASSIGEYLSQNTTGTVSDDDIFFAIASTTVVFPDSMTNARRKGLQWWWQDITVQVSSIAFTPTVSGCSSNCTYNAAVMWSSIGWAMRPCSTPILPSSDSALPTPTTLPSDVYGPGSLIVVDVVYNYTPLVATHLFGKLTITRSFYVQPRYVPSIKYTPSSGGAAMNCPAA